MSTVSRLITHFIPEHYQLSLELNRTGRSFRGTVAIQGVLQPDASQISLHAKDLTIESVLIDGKRASFTQGENDEIHLTQDDLQPGAHVVVVGFDGHITDAMNGIYPCHYEHAGVKKELLATQFESHHAREAFPCIDEPEAKATFDLTLTAEDGVTALSNMPILSQDSDGRHTVTIFQQTPRMSTYLLAFVVGELHKVTARTKNDVEINVWATPAQSTESLTFALDTAVKVTEFFEDYFNTPYPLPKCDHVALPDFAAGAMENWGLITYRELALLADPDTSSVASRQYIARVVAHEISHQWFGNLVTMKWWDNLWLNESFATLMMYLSVDAIYPEWNSWVDFSTSQDVLAIDRDSIDGVQPVQTNVGHPDEISTLFDPAIVYAKGARLLCMLQHYVGDAAFQAGLTDYFRRYAYTNTEGDDLWREIGNASGKDIVTLMNTWIAQPGFPVVHVSKTDSAIELRQERFFVGPHQPSDALWPIPLDATDTNAPELLDTSSASFASNTAVVRLNSADAAHFITHYDDSGFHELTKQLAAGTLPELTRVQLLNESVILARGGIISSAQLIPLIAAYKNETSEHVWNSITAALAELRKFVEYDAAADQSLRTFVCSVARQQYERLGWEVASDEPESDTRLRRTIVGLMLYGDDPEATQTAKSLFDTTILEALNPNLRQLIIKSVARHGDDSIVDELLAKYKQTSSAELQRDISVGISATQLTDKLIELLDILRDSNTVRAQDVAKWFVQLIRNPAGRELAWQWVQDNWQWIVDTFGGGKNYDDFPRYSADSLGTQQQLDTFTAFFEPKKDIPALTRVIAMGTVEIQGRVQLIERDTAAVRQALADL